MLSSLRKRIDNDEDGFTLIELMVVVLIIAILIAIAIPTFLGAQNRAKDRSAQSDVRNGITNVRSIATDNSGALDLVTAAELNLAEPNITFDETATGEDVVTVVRTGSPVESVTLYTKSESGDKWYASATNVGGEVVSCDGTSAAAVDTFDECEAIANPPVVP